MKDLTPAIQRASIVFLLLLFLLPATHTRAQLTLGVNLDGNSLSLSGDKPAAGGKYNVGIGGGVGLELEIYLSPVVILSIGGGYQTGVGNIQYPDTVDGAFRVELAYKDSIDVQLSNIYFPLLIKVLTDNKRMEVLAGIQLEISQQSIVTRGGTESDVSEFFEDYNIVAVLGLGYRIPIREHLIRIGISYQQGLRNLSSKDSDPSNLLPRVKTSRMVLSLGWNINVSRKKRNP